MKKTFKFKLVNIFTASCLLVSTVYLASAFLIKTQTAQAANCGGAVVCNCGDTVTSDYTLTNDLICTFGNNALIIGADNITIDGQNLYKIRFNNNGAKGYGIYSNNYNDITIKNLTFENIDNGIYITATVAASNILIDNNILTDNHFAITTLKTNFATISNNTIEHADATAILLMTANNNLVENNILIENGHTIWTQGIQNSIIQNNQFIKNRYQTNITTALGNTIQNNTLTDNSYTHMIVFNETAANRITTVGSPIFLDFDLIDYSTLTACPAGTCTYAISTYPAESITPTLFPPPGNKIQANFTPSKNGTYSVKISATDSSNNSESRSYRFFIGPVITPNIKYYLNDIIPTHGQSNDQDSGSWLKTSSTFNGGFLCNYWIQASIEEQPDYPISTINNISTDIWYKMNSAVPPGSNLDAWTGLQRYGTRYVYSGAAKGILFDFHVNTPYNTVYTKPSYAFPLLNWAMDYPWNWYDFMVKMETAGGTGLGGSDGPNWQTEIGDLNSSQITINYSAPTSPLIKSISNNDINILAAIQPDPLDPNSAEIILSGTGLTDLVIDSYASTFPGYQNILAAAILPATIGTNTVQLTGLAGETTITNIPLQIIPDAGQITVNVNTWHTSGDNYKKWTEDGSIIAINTNHIIGDLLPLTIYPVRANGISIGTFASNASGEITFPYIGGYSAEVLFEVGVLPTLGGSIPAYEGTVGVSINNNQDNTTSPTVIINLTANSSNEMLISDNANFIGATWEPFAAEKSWTFDSALGVKTIYVKFRNSFGLESAVISDSINLVAEETGEVPADSPVVCQASLPLNIQIGNLLKVANSTTVYIVGLDNCRYIFPNEPTYFTWFADFSGVKTVSVELISQINLGKNVTVRPGTALVKIQSEPKVYMVEPGAKLIPLDSATAAVALFGANWPSKVIDIPDVFFTDYQKAAPITGYADGTIIQYQNDANIYYLENGNKRLINTEIFNKLFQAKYLLRNISRTFDYADGLNFPNTIIADIMNWQ